MCYRSKNKPQANFPWDKPINDGEKESYRTVEKDFYRPAILPAKDVIQEQNKIIYWN